VTQQQRQKVLDGFLKYKENNPHYISTTPSYGTIFHICWLIYCEETEKITLDCFFDKFMIDKKLSKHIDEVLWKQASIIYKTGQ